MRIRDKHSGCATLEKSRLVPGERLLEGPAKHGHVRLCPVEENIHGLGAGEVVLLLLLPGGGIPARVPCPHLTNHTRHVTLF
jgi:hypothetical protein